MLWTCCEHVVKCCEHGVKMLWTCGENVVKMWWTCCEHVMNMSWGERGGKAHPHIIWPYIMFCGATSENLPNLVIYEIWRKNLNVSERRTDKVRFRGACFAPKKQEASSILRVVLQDNIPFNFSRKIWICPAPKNTSRMIKTFKALSLNWNILHWNPSYFWQMCSVRSTWWAGWSAPWPTGAPSPSRPTHRIIVQ